MDGNGRVGTLSGPQGVPCQDDCFAIVPHLREPTNTNGSYFMQFWIDFHLCAANTFFLHGAGPTHYNLGMSTQHRIGYICVPDGHLTSGAIHVACGSGSSWRSASA
eukprot:618280-Pyramimonas_sp.AAC.1